MVETLKIMGLLSQLKLHTDLTGVSWANSISSF